MRLLYAGHAADRRGIAGPRRYSEPRANPRPPVRELLPLHGLSRNRRRGGIRGAGALRSKAMIARQTSTPASRLAAPLAAEPIASRAQLACMRQRGAPR